MCITRLEFLLRFLLAGDLKMRAVLDFDPKQMSVREKCELQEIIQLQRQRRKTGLCRDEEVVKNQSGENYNSEEDEEPKAVVLSFKKGDRMETILSANIG